MRRRAFLAKASQDPELAGLFSAFQINVPQLDADVDRAKARQLGVAVQNIFETMQIYLGSLYVNDFNRFGRTYQVSAQADAEFRDRADDIGQLKMRNAAGEMVPLVRVAECERRLRSGARDALQRLPRADINGGAGARVRVPARPRRRWQKHRRRDAAEGHRLEWTELTYQEILAGNTALLIFPLCILLVFLVLAAQYESLRCRCDHPDRADGRCSPRCRACG